MRRWLWSLVVLAVAACNNTSSSSGGTSSPTDDVGTPLHPHAVAQIEALLAEKTARTTPQRKIASRLLLAKNGMPAGVDWKGYDRLDSTSARDQAGRSLLDVRGVMSPAMIQRIEALGGAVVNTSATGSSARVWLPLEELETLAAEPAIETIRPALEAQTLRADPPRGATKHAVATRAERVAAVQRAVKQLAKRQPPAAGITPGAAPGSVTSEGRAAHAADRARKYFNTDGTGVRVGVLSDSDDWKEQSIATGDLPADTITVPGQDGRPGTGEGTAMMEIVHDLAPGAQLFFATAFNSAESFADNIRALRFVYRCDVIIDDILYFDESPFQDDIIAQAVDDVAADGALYFSAAGNDGNYNDGTSATWEGDFTPGGTLATLPSGYTVHDFGGRVISNRVELRGGPLVLQWSDPGTLDRPASANDYDLFVLDQDLRNVMAAATDVQDGTGWPIEYIGYYIPPDFRVVVAKSPTASRRALHLSLYGGELGLSTPGATHGHNSARNGFGTAAVDVLEAGGGAFAAGSTTPVELFSSDGERWIFYDRDNNPLSGGVTFASGGGELRRKPDLAAADGVSTTLPSSAGLSPFFGTSAAAPHAGAIAALLKAAVPSATAGHLRRALLSGALDVEANRFDRDTGAGVASAMRSLSAIHATPGVFLDLETVTPAPVGSDAILPGGGGTVLVELKNNGGAVAKITEATLTTSAPYVTITQASTTYPVLGAGDSATNVAPFAFTLSTDTPCGAAIDFTLSVTYSGVGPVPPRFHFTVQTGRPAATSKSTAYEGAPVPIPDDDLAGVDIPLSVKGVGRISKAVLQIDGATCSAEPGSTTVGIAHTWAGDIIAQLAAPDGKSLTVIKHAGGSINGGNNFCQTVLDDGATASIQDVSSAGAPWTGTFSPANPLAAFVGTNGDGTWVLNVADTASLDTGTVHAFSLRLSGFTCTP